MDWFKSILEFKLINFEGYSLSLYQVLLVFAINFLTKSILWTLRKAINHTRQLQTIDSGNREALFQIVRYFIWIIAIIISLETLGIKLNVLLAGSAALLVGLGLGLQQIFNDIISGIILLIEGTLRVGDILEIDDDIVRVEEIGLRTSKVINRNDITIFMPNSKMVNEKVINWSIQTRETRFKIKVGVAYGSDVNKVIKLLEESAASHRKSSQRLRPIARFINFGDSSLDFELLFWSDEIFRIENIKSDIRISINQKFLEHKVIIPFPQRDLHLKSSDIPLGQTPQ